MSIQSRAGETYSDAVLRTARAGGDMIAGLYAIAKDNNTAYDEVIRLLALAVADKGCYYVTVRYTLNSTVVRLLEDDGLVVKQIKHNEYTVALPRRSKQAT